MIFRPGWGETGRAAPDFHCTARGKLVGRPISSTSFGDAAYTMPLPSASRGQRDEPRPLVRRGGRERGFAAPAAVALPRCVTPVETSEPGRNYARCHARRFPLCSGVDAETEHCSGLSVAHGGPRRDGGRHPLV